MILEGKHTRRHTADGWPGAYPGAHVSYLIVQV